MLDKQRITLSNAVINLPTRDIQVLLTENIIEILFLVMNNNCKPLLILSKVET